MKETNLNKNSENTAKTIMKELPISTKHAIELCSLLRYKTVEEAKKILEGVIIDNKPIKYNRFTAGAGHKSNIGSGKIPIKASEHILKAIKSVESNALTKGLSKNLKITHLLANKASRPFHYGR
ncbi:MAG: 50S ribosomal protein L22, partial [Nanoarchaeota archaeon]|nr:50S ribosomal protein L22 [Nanoarchaeota archaeon]